MVVVDGCVFVVLGLRKKLVLHVEESVHMVTIS